VARRKFKKLIMGLLICVAGGILISCNDGISKGKVDNFKKTGYTTVDGTEFASPLKISDLESLGYTLDTESLGLGDDNKIQPGMHYSEYVRILKDGEDTGAKCKVINVGRETKAINDCSIYYLKFSDETFSLRDGVTVGTDEETLTKVFGEPLEKSEGGDITTIKYADDNKGFLIVEFAKGTSITMEYYLNDEVRSGLYEVGF